MRQCWDVDIGRANEDRVQIFHQGHLWMYGIFDGHGAPHKDSMMANHLQTFLFPQLAEAITRQGLSFKVIEQVYRDVDHELLGKTLTGSTAVIAIVVPNRIYLVNLGDSRGVLFNTQGQILFETVDHKPNSPSEKARIEKLGGHVIFLSGTHRVQGNLATSRSFGDYMLKQTGTGVYNPEGWVSVKPTIVEMNYIPGDTYLLLASDGLWDGISSRQAVDLAMRQGCRALVLAARRLTNDDISVLLVPL